MVLAVLILTIIIAVVLFFTEKRRKERKISNVNKQIINDNNTYVGLTTTNENNSLNIRNKKPINGFLIMLSVGVFLIILSSIIFATSTWKSYSSNLKVLMLFGETILFLLLGLVLKYVFKVTNTGNALTFISSVLLSSTFLCAGYFKLFGDDFSLTGTYSDIFLSITFLIETLALIIRMLITNNKKYIFPLICFLVSMFLLVRGVINSEIFAFTFTYIIILGINYFKDKIFDDTKAFNIFNIVLSAIFTFIYLYLCVQFNFSRILLSSLKQPSLITNSMILFDLLSLLFFGTSLVINFIKTNGRINIAALVYESFIVVCYAIFVGDLAISSFALSISGFIL